MNVLRPPLLTPVHVHEHMLLVFYPSNEILLLSSQDCVRSMMDDHMLYPHVEITFS